MGELRSLAVYVTGHGFGHAVRTSAVLRSFRRRAPEVPVRVRTEAPGWIFGKSDGTLQVVPGEVGVGLAQDDALSVNVEETLRRLGEFDRSWNRRVDDEVAWLREVRAALVLADIPPLAFAAAREAGLPAIGLGNFSWDWIYDAYARTDARFRPFAGRAREAYGVASLLLRLPFHGNMDVFPEIRDISLIARETGLSRLEARRRLGLPSEGPVVLLGFGGYGVPGLPVKEMLRDMPEIRFVTTGTLHGIPPGRAVNLMTFPGDSVDYPLLLRAADAVVTKPGYGMVTECLRAETRVLYTGRDSFAEFPLLADALERYGTARFVSVEALRRGEIREPLRELLRRSVHGPALDFDGAERAAGILLEAFHGGGR